MLKLGLDLNKLNRILSNSRKGAGRRLTAKTINMPLSFQGFGAMAIIAMVLILAAAQGIEYLKAHRRHH